MAWGELLKHRVQLAFAILVMDNVLPWRELQLGSGWDCACRGAVVTGAHTTHILTQPKQQNLWHAVQMRMA